jgi:antitoxin PrlF
MSTRAVSKLTSKYQTTIPAAVRDALLLEKGDSIVFEVGDDGVIVLRKGVPLDVTFVEAVQSQLTEWDSAEDDEAYRDL